MPGLPIYEDFLAMMTPRNVVAVAFMMLAAASQVEAQGGGRGGGGGGRGGGGMGGGQNVERVKEMLFANITLDAVQAKAVDSIMTATVAKRQEMMQAMRGGGGDRDAMREQMQSSQTEERTALRTLLTTEQQTVFDKNVEAMPAPGRRGPPPVRE